MEMTHLQLVIYCITLVCTVFLISYLMEIYKKQLRKNKASKYENCGIAFALSILAVILLNLINIFKPVLGLIGAPIWADWILYTIAFYIAQFEMSMKLIKRITKKFIANFLESKGFSEEDIKKLMED